MTTSNCLSAIELATAVRSYCGNWRDSSREPRYCEVEPTADQAVAAAQYSGVDAGDDLEFFCRAAWQTAADELIAALDEAAQQAQLAADLKKMADVDSLARLVEEASDVELRRAAGGSYYGCYKRGEVALKLRVSDHSQVLGGGWSEDRQEQMGEADASFEIGREWTRAAIRGAIAEAVRAARR